MIRARDQYGNDRSQAAYRRCQGNPVPSGCDAPDDSNQFTVTYAKSGGNNIAVSDITKSGGTSDYIVKYTITEAGTYSFTVRTNGGVVATKSVTVVADSTAMAFTECSGDGLQSAMQNAATTVTITTADAYGNPTVTTDDNYFSYYLVPQPGTATTTTLTGSSSYDGGSNTHSVQYTPVAVGRYNLTIYRTGQWDGNGEPPANAVPISGQSFPLVAGVTSPQLAELRTPFEASDNSAVQVCLKPGICFTSAMTHAPLSGQRNPCQPRHICNHSGLLSGNPEDGDDFWRDTVQPTTHSVFYRKRLPDG